MDIYLIVVDCYTQSIGLTVKEIFTTAYRNYSDAEVEAKKLVDQLNGNDDGTDYTYRIQPVYLKNR